MKLMLAEDEPGLSRALAAILQHSDYEVDTALDGLTALEYLLANDYDAAILDIMMPGMDGITATSKIREFSNVPIILLTAKSETEDKVLALNVGADDYITKPFGMMEFVARVKAVLRRTLEQPDDKYMTIGDIFLDNERHVVYVDNKGIELTYKEYELLKLLMHNAGIVLTREKIMERVWDTEFEGESRTVDMHIKTLRKKLGDSSRHIKTVRNVGYVME